VASREQVRELVGQDLPYPEIGARLGIPAGQAYLIGTGVPADGGDTHTPGERHRTGVLSSAQHLLGVHAENPTRKQFVLDWIARRVAADEQMRRAGAGSEAA
jgi:hypothetical protein